MKKASSARISISLFVDTHSVFKYYNTYDPAPLNNRQLSDEPREYLQNSVASARHNAIIRNKSSINCDHL